MGEDGGRHSTALPIPAPAPASAGVTENGASSVPNASVTAARPPARDAEQVRGNLGSTALDHPQQQQQRQGRPAASIAAPPRYVAPFFAQAAQPEIIRANQKDLYYLLQLTDQLEEVVRGLFGTRWLQTFSTEVGLASQIAYYGLTTLLGSQTLGEEYVDILQYSSRTRKIPTLLTRSLLLFSHILAPYFLAKAYGQIKRRIAASRASDALRERVPTDAQVLFDSTTTADEDNLFSDEPARAVAAQPAPAPISSVQPVTSRLPLASLFSSIELPHLESLLDEHLRAIHLAVFYLVGRYYQVSKRLLGVRYLSMQNKAEGAKPPSYEVLGVLMTVQLGVRLLAYAYRRRKQAKEAARQAEKEVKEKLEGAGHEHKQRQPALVDGEPISALLFDPEDPSSGAAGEAEEEFEPVEARRCTLCLGPRKDPAATECGHCFCYTCIVAWTREKPECPLCRSRVKLSKILPLYHV